jgi:hypothetical protein
MLPRKKASGFFILEVLFAIIIISAAMAGVFRVLHRAIILVGKLKHNTEKIIASPLIYSVYSPRITMHRTIDEISGGGIHFVNVRLIQNSIELDKNHLYAIKKNSDGSDQHVFYSNSFMHLPDNKNDKEGNA